MSTKSSKAIYKFHFDCGRMGTLTGVFIEDPARVKKLIESQDEIYFGEVLGKHSEIAGPLSEEDVTLVSDDPKAIEIIESLDLETGFNPVQTYIEWKEDQGESHIFQTAARKEEQP